MARTKSAIYGPALVATGPTTLFTAGASELIEVQLISVSNPTGAAVNLTLSVGADAAGTRILGTNTVANIPANTPTPVQIVGPIYVPAGTVFTASASTNNVLNIKIDGIRHTIG
jgi:hypothetical protein